MQIGDTFMIEDEDGVSEHLHVILTNPDTNGEVLTVSISTRRPRSETLVCICVGEHPFITHESVCLYRFAKIRSAASIELAIKDGSARPKESASLALIEKLSNGLLESEFVPHGISAFYREVTGK